MTPTRTSDQRRPVRQPRRHRTLRRVPHHPATRRPSPAVPVRGPHLERRLDAVRRRGRPLPHLLGLVLPVGAASDDRPRPRRTEDVDLGVVRRRRARRPRLGVPRPRTDRTRSTASPCSATPTRRPNPGSTGTCRCRRCGTERPASVVSNQFRTIGIDLATQFGALATAGDRHVPRGTRRRDRATRRLDRPDRQPGRQRRRRRRPGAAERPRPCCSTRSASSTSG